MADAKWYVVHTQTGVETKARASLISHAETAGLPHLIHEVLIPLEKVSEVKGGKKRISERKFFPGYILVNMELDETSWHVVKGTPKVTGFVGGTIKPPVVPDEEVARLFKRIEEGSLRPAPKTLFEKGENVRVTSGPFSNFAGIVDEVNNEKGKLRVLVSIFGRSTPIELEFTQVEKTT